MVRNGGVALIIALSTLWQSKEKKQESLEIFKEKINERKFLFVSNQK